MSDSINSVNVLSIDEERRKFRVILGFTGAGVGGNPNRLDIPGQFTVNLPPPIAIANSDQFDNCVVKIDSFTAMGDAAIIVPTWRYSGGVLKVPAIEIRGNLPSSNVLSMLVILLPLLQLLEVMLLLLLVQVLLLLMPYYVLILLEKI